MRISRQSACIVCIVILMIVPAVLQAQASVDHGRIAHVVMNPTQLLFKPQIQGADITLTVSGPNDFYYQQTFDHRGTPAFLIIDRAGTTLPDGGYNYELGVKWNLPSDVQQAMSRARETGDYSEIDNLRQRGRIPETVKPQSGYFTIASGKILIDDGTEEKGARLEGTTSKPKEALAPYKDVLHYDDVIITGSLCVGFDCASGESFGFDTIILKEHNLRVYFNDTSYTASYPTNAWRMTVNDSTNGGASYFSIDDADDGTSIFKIEAGAPSNSLYVEDYGRVGFGTSTPAVELHVKDNDTPTLRLEQDTSGGWTAQTFDVAANESNFFIRDATNGSKLPFRIQPGTPSSTLSLKSNGYVGIGTWSPDAPIDVETSDSYTFFRLTATGASPNQAADMTFTDGGAEGIYRINIVDGDSWEWQVDNDGNVEIKGTLTTTGSCSGGCDRVFSPGYELESIEEHADYMWSNMHLRGIGPTTAGQPINVSEKTEGLINELEKAHIFIDQLNDRLTLTNDRVHLLVEENRILHNRLRSIEESLTRAR